MVRLADDDVTETEDTVSDAFHHLLKKVGDGKVNRPFRLATDIIVSLDPIRILYQIISSRT